jgi:O-Antigen ligase
MISVNHIPVAAFSGRKTHYVRRARLGRLNSFVWFCLWFVLIPQMVSVFEDVLSAFRVLPVVGLAGTLGAMILLRRRLLSGPIVWPFIFLFAAVVSTVLNTLLGNSIEDSFGFLYQIASGISLYLMVLATVTTRRRFVYFSVLLIVGAMITAGFLVWQNYVAGVDTPSYVYGESYEVQRGFSGNQNWLAPLILAGMTSCFCLFEIYQGKWSERFLLLLGAGLYLSCFFTASRGTVTAATVLLALWLLLSKRINSYIFVGLAVAVTLYQLQDLSIISYALWRISESNTAEIASETRFDLIVDALKIWSENPVFGAGLGAVMETTGHAAHMAFTGLLAETGLVGFVVFYFPLLLVVSRGFRQGRLGNMVSWDKRVLKILVTGLAVFVLHGLFNETYFIKSFYVELGLVAVMLQTLRLSSSRPKQSVVMNSRSAVRRHSLYGAARVRRP